MTKKDEKIDIKYDFLVHNCTQEQSGSPYFSSIVRQYKWSSLSRKNVEIKKTCYHGTPDVTILLSVTSKNKEQSGPAGVGRWAQKIRQHSIVETILDYTSRNVGF